METRKLGGSQLHASVIGFGAWAAGKAGWGDPDERELERAIWEAYDNGVNFFDTAPVYGFGESERVLGRVLKPVRDQVFLATKFGLVWDETGIRNNVARANIFREIEESLRRLDTEYIDLYQVHWPDPEDRTPIAETIGALNDLVKAGKIRYIGVSNFSVSQLAQAQATAPVVSLQSPYNLLQRKVEDAELPYTHANGIGFIPYSPLAQGLLTGKFTRDSAIPADDVRKQLNPLFAPDSYAQALLKVEKLKEVANKYGKTPAQTALNWLAAKPGITTIIAGAKTSAQVRENLGGVGWRLDDEDVNLLNTWFG
ncbi:aldo/keto reductase [Cohnella caldifontis]|uniref:aldo/keto reductase n=1 Tax=Cohnella caldifontis TaxID=3027471 RepID=UPI0023EC0465|nr:aldo/keto reductase [Cohnella sp. YIM B05605]